MPKQLRDLFLAHLGGVQKTGSTAGFVARVAVVLARRPPLLGAFAHWTARRMPGVGPLALLRHGVRPVTFVMHSFMDVDVVQPAWEALQSDAGHAGAMSEDPRIVQTQVRPRACPYAMAHPETGELVPARVQHAVLDPAENVALRRLPPLTPVSSR